MSEDYGPLDRGEKSCGCPDPAHNESRSSTDIGTWPVTTGPRATSPNPAHNESRSSTSVSGFSKGMDPPPDGSLGMPANPSHGGGQYGAPLRDELYYPGSKTVAGGEPGGVKVPDTGANYGT